MTAVPAHVRSAPTPLGTVLAGTLAALVLVPAPPAEGQHRDADGDITMAKVGDLIISRDLQAYEEPEFLRLRDEIRGATVGLGNMEMLLHEYEDDVIPQAQAGGTYMAGPPSLAEEIAWMGLDMLSLANNHTMDFGVGGLRRTVDALAGSDVDVAGVGENLARAYAPAYRETPGGRVALISVASTFDDHMRAGHQRPDVRGRPGLAPMRFQVTHEVPEERFEALREMQEELGLSGSSSDGEVRLRQTDGSVVIYRPGDGYRTTTEPYEEDLDALLRTIEDARRQAHWVVVTTHTHEGGGNEYRPEGDAGDRPGCLGLYEDECDEGRFSPADALVAFARASIDAGADAFYGHGPHLLRGVEIYRGKPIFYSLGDFVFQNETPPFQPWDNYAGQELDPFRATPADFYDSRPFWPENDWWWDGAVAVTEFRNGELYEIRMIPTHLFHDDRPTRGRPVASTGEDLDRGLALIEHLSEPFGTEVEVVDGEAVIRGPAAADGRDER